MKTSNRIKGTTLKRFLGVDGSFTYQYALGGFAGVVWAPVMLWAESKNIPKPLKGLMGACVITTTVLVTDKCFKARYTPLEFGIIFTTTTVGSMLFEYNKI